VTDRDERAMPTEPGATRRAVLLGAGALGAAGVLAACGGDTTTGSGSPTAGGPTAGGPSPTGGPAGPTGGGGTIKTSAIPVGGGTIFPDQHFVVTQPTRGSFKAFSATCTHMQCTLGSVSGGKIICPCHGSQYNIADGSVAVGPATRGLPAKTITVSGDTLTVS
jgi:Rieske Fe-S protein